VADERDVRTAVAERIEQLERVARLKRDAAGELREIADRLGPIGWQEGLNMERLVRALRVHAAQLDRSAERDERPAAKLRRAEKGRRR
jgi:hypothetical protein